MQTGALGMTNVNLFIFGKGGPADPAEINLRYERDLRETHFLAFYLFTISCKADRRSMPHKDTEIKCSTLN